MGKALTGELSCTRTGLVKAGRLASAAQYFSLCLTFSMLLSFLQRKQHGKFLARLIEVYDGKVSQFTGLYTLLFAKKVLTEITAFSVKKCKYNHDKQNEMLVKINFSQLKK